MYERRGLQMACRRYAVIFSLATFFCMPSFGDEPNVLAKQVASRLAIVNCVRQSNHAQALIDHENEIAKVGGYLNTEIIHDSSALIVDCRTATSDAYNTYRSAGGKKSLQAIKAEDEKAVELEWKAIADPESQPRGEETAIAPRRNDESYSNEINKLHDINTKNISPSSRPLSRDESDYIQKVRQLANNRINYPDSARESRDEGSCEVQVNWSRSGNITEVSLLKRSGKQYLDEECVNVFKRIQRFPSTDEFSGQQFLSSTFSFVFNPE